MKREQDRGPNQEVNIEGFPKHIPPKGILPEWDGTIVGPKRRAFTGRIGPDPNEPFRGLERLQEEWAEEKRRERKERIRRLLRSLDKS